VLLLGVGHQSNTSLHLAEYRASYPGRRVVGNGVPMLVNGKREWVKIEDLDIDASDFVAIGDGFERSTGYVHRGRVANAESMLLPQRALIDYAVQWMERNR